MAKDVIMPALGMAQETGILLQWLKAEGDEVTKGEPLLEIETDKATVEVEATATGTLVNISASPGDEIPVGQVIALILASGEAAPEPIPEPTSSKSAEVAAPTSIPATGPNDKGEVRASPLAARIAAKHNIDLQQVETSGVRIQKEDILAYLESQQTPEPAGPTDGRTPASPKARRLAREKNLALETIPGSGPEGAVVAADVQAATVDVQAATADVQAATADVQAATARPVEPASAQGQVAPSDEAQTLRLSRMWQVMAQRLSESWQTVPHFYLVRETNAGQLVLWRERARQRSGESITYTDLMVKLVAEALRHHPRINAGWVGGTIVVSPTINIGLAVAVDEGLLVPVIHQAEQLGLNNIAARRAELVGKAHSGKLSLADLSNGTFTISNLGMYGVDAFNAIVNPPQAAILALGQIAQRVVPVHGRPGIQPMLTMTLSCDHRVIDGARAAQFLQTLVDFIEDPLKMMD